MDDKKKFETYWGDGPSCRQPLMLQYSSMPDSARLLLQALNDRCGRNPGKYRISEAVLEHDLQWSRGKIQRWKAILEAKPRPPIKWCPSKPLIIVVREDRPDGADRTPTNRYELLWDNIRAYAVNPAKLNIGSPSIRSEACLASELAPSGIRSDARPSIRISEDLASGLRPKPLTTNPKETSLPVCVPETESAPSPILVSNTHTMEDGIQFELVSNEQQQSIDGKDSWSVFRSSVGRDLFSWSDKQSQSITGFSLPLGYEAVLAPFLSRYRSSKIKSCIHGILERQRDQYKGKPFRLDTFRLQCEAGINSDAPRALTVDMSYFDRVADGVDDCNSPVDLTLAVSRSGLYLVAQHVSLRLSCPLHQALVQVGSIIEEGLESCSDDPENKADLTARILSKRRTDPMAEPEDLAMVDSFIDSMQAKLLALGGSPLLPIPINNSAIQSEPS